MLYIIYGNDRDKARVRFCALRESLGKKCADMSVCEHAQAEERSVLEGEVSEGVIDAAVASQGLFGNTTLFVFDGVLEKKAEQELVVARARELVSSPNTFLIFEPAFGKEGVRAFQESGAVAEEFVIKKADTRPAFNIFALGDALGKRDRKELWVLYQGAIAAGMEPEEICGTLFWSVKNMALMKNAEAGDDAGLNPFVAKKARAFAKNYTHEEIVGLSRALVSCYHEAHRGGEPMDIALERFILNL